MGKDIIITNNPMVKEKDGGSVFIDGSYEDVLYAVRDRVHMGHRLITHPLSGSVKPGETPYKTVVISSGKRGFDGSPDIKSLEIIEDAIAAARKFVKKNITSPRILKDFQLIDYSLIFS